MVEMSEQNAFQEKKNYKSGILLSKKSYMNGDDKFFGTKSRSDTVTSSDSDSQLENIIEKADRIQNGSLTKEPPKKQVRFNLDGIEHFSYSYSCSSSPDQENATNNDLLNNINFACHDAYDDYSDDDNDEDDDDDDDDDEDDGDEDDDDNDDETDEGETSSEEGSSFQSNFGYLVNKSISQEVNNNRTEFCTNDSIQNGIDNESGKLQSVGYDHNEITESKLYQDKKLMDLERQVEQLESGLKKRKDSINRHLDDLSEKLKVEREKTRQEIDHLQVELENRRHDFVTEMEEMKMRREQQAKKFEEELEEFQNEKKLEERRQKYHEHEALISQKEEELASRRKQALEQETEIEDYESYLNRRHNMCNTKEGDLNVLQNELETLAKELESRKTQLQNKVKELEPLVDERSEEERCLKASLRTGSPTASRVTRGNDPRMEELKQENRQILDDLFALKKTCEQKDNEMEELRGKFASAEYEKKRLTQKVSHLEYELELARKGAGNYESPESVDQIMRKASVSIRQARSSRVMRPTLAANHQSSLSISTPTSRLLKLQPSDSRHSFSSESLSSSRGSKESDPKSSSESKKGKTKISFRDAKERSTEGRHKKDSEKVTSALCSVM